MKVSMATCREMWSEYKLISIVSACLLTAKNIGKSSWKTKIKINFTNIETSSFHFSYFAVFVEEICDDGSKLQHIPIECVNRCNEFKRSVGQREHGKFFYSTQSAINSQSRFPRFVVHIVIDDCDSLTLNSMCTEIKVAHSSNLKFFNVNLKLTRLND